ncbi:MAG: ABC transporter substrate-binding protein [Clostridiaceae bacterium]
MKKKLFSLLSMLFALIFSFSLLSGCSTNQETTLKKIKLNEVVRSVFYAPMYVAINEGFFKEEGLDIDLSTGQGAETTIAKTQVL